MYIQDKQLAETIKQYSLLQILIPLEESIVILL